MQEIDSRILEKTLFIRKVPLRISEVDEPLTNAKLELDRINQKNETLSAKKREKEKLLEETNEKIKKIKLRASEVKTNKEYQAHLKEIEAFEKEIAGIEEEILVIMVELDNSLKVQKEKDDVVKVEVDKINAFKRQLDLEVEAHQKELSLLEQERADLSRSVEPELYRLYSKLLNSGNGVAITAAQNEICMGCNMNIPPQLFVEIRKNEEVIQCPQCQRILFYPDDLPQNGSSD